jgi:FRG domain-containing protein
MPFREIEVQSLGELIDRVTPPAPDPATGRHRDTGVYRGSGDAGWPMLTSLDRLGGVHPPHTKAGLEEHILRNFIRYSRPHLQQPPANEWELLVTAQHHGLPTRLLDWSYSPLVALHFATRRHAGDCDHAVWRLDWQRVHRHFGFPELALLIEDLEGLFQDGRRFTPWMLFSGAFDQRPFACLLEPPSLDARIVTQSAAFTLCSDKGQPFERFLAQLGLGDALTKFVVPREAAARLRDQLDLVGIDERRLFPDLDGLAAQLHRYYS